VKLVTTEVCAFRCTIIKMLVSYSCRNSYYSIAVQRGFSDDLLGTLFAHAVLGNSVVAIVSGVVAQKAVDLYGFV